MIPYLLAVVGGYLIGNATKDETPKFGSGGTLEEQNNEMLKSNVKEIKHHAEELQNIVKDGTKVDAWVVAKAERSASDLSDITHYLDGKETFKKGGKVKEKWIQDAIKNEGALRRTAKREGLIKGEEKLSQSDLEKLERKGGKTAKRAYLAETLKGMK